MNRYLLILSLIIAFSSCERYVDLDEDDIDYSKFSDWTEQTHGKSATPNYDEVFDDYEVLRFDIKIDSSAWNRMQENIAGLVSTAVTDLYGNVSLAESPVMVPCSFNYNGVEWYNVGIRFKGNNSLIKTYNAGIKKLAFKLDFDEFEDSIPNMKNQRFYGFRQLNLLNNYKDESFVKEKVVSDLFREFGLHTSHVSFCKIYIDYGEGSKYYGVYSIVEDVDDTMLENQLGSKTGNLYKPTGSAATFAEGTYEQTEIGKSNNEFENDFTDVKSLYDIVNSNERISTPAVWQTSLSAAFDVDMFLKWLAANTVIENRDAYGNVGSNYLLYNNPITPGLTWLPSDFRKSLESGKKSALSFSMNEVSASWPLIRYIMDVSEYRDLYYSYIQKFSQEVYTTDKMNSKYNRYQTMLQAPVTEEESGYSFIFSEIEFNAAIDDMKQHVQTRETEVETYLNYLGL